MSVNTVGYAVDNLIYGSKMVDQVVDHLISKFFGIMIPKMRNVSSLTMTLSLSLALTGLSDLRYRSAFAFNAAKVSTDLCWGMLLLSGTPLIAR